jgi:hypothetical protein
VKREDSIAQLLDAAIPALPRALQAPPLARIRRKARRRRAAAIGGTALAIALVISAGVLVAGGHSLAGTGGTSVVGSVPTGAAEPTNSPTASAPPAGSSGRLADGRVPWAMAELDRAGTALTIYVPPPGWADCQVYPHPVATVSGQPGTTVVITVTAGAATRGDDCTRTSVDTQLSLTLPAPLGARAINDGYDHMARVVFRDRELPIVPSPWTRVPVEFAGNTDPAVWFGAYTRPGGPDIHIRVGVGALPANPVSPVSLGIRPGFVYLDGKQYSAQWRVGDLVYALSLQTAEGEASATLYQLHEVLAKLTWSQ